MNISEKVLQLKQDFDDVYMAGKAAGGDGIGYEQGFEDGKNSVVDYSKYAKEIRFRSFNDFDKSEVELTLNYATNISDMFNLTSSSPLEYANNTVEHFTINIPNLITSTSYAFSGSNTRNNKKLKRITLNLDMRNVTTVRNMFYFCSVLEVIDGTPLNFSGLNIDSTTSTASAFSYCNELREVRFIENTIPKTISFSSSSKLSDISIQSIIDGLVDLTGSTTQTLTLHATVGAKLTEEQKAAITAKNWELVY